MHATSGPLRPPLWARAADVGVIALLFFALYVGMAGGFVWHPAGLRISFRSEWRVVGWAAGLFVLRHLFVRRPALHQRLAAAFSRAAASQRALPLDDVEVGAAGQRQIARAAVWTLGVLALFWALTFAMTYPQVQVLDRGVSLDTGDPLLSTWRLAWIAHQLPRDPLHLFDGNIFYPAKNTLAFSDAMLVPSLMAAPLLWLGVHQLLVYNLLLLSGFALSGAAMFLLVKSLTRHVGAALVAGFVFAFLPYRYMHYAHLELQVTQWMPLCLWAFHRTTSAGRLRDGLLTGLFIALQTLSSFYYGIFFVTYLVPVGAALLIGARREHVWPAVRALAAGAVLAAAIVVPFTRPYFEARKAVGERPISEVLFYSATPRDYLVAHPRNTYFGPITAGEGSQERELFEGLVVPAIAVAAMWPPISAARMGYCVGFALAFEISLGTNGMVYPWLREHVTPFRGLRVPARMAILVGLSLAILVGYAVARISRGGSTRAARIAAVIVIALPIALEYRATLELRDVWRTPAPVYDSLAGHPEAVLLELPLIAPDVALEPIFMYFSTFHWHRLVNGYSGFSPPGYMKLLEHMKYFPDDDTIQEIRLRGVDYVIVHGALFNSEEQFLSLIRRLDQRPELHLESVTRWEGNNTRLYRVLK
jgi:hypothetical protein